MGQLRHVATDKTATLIGQRVAATIGGMKFTDFIGLVVPGTFSLT